MSRVFSKIFLSGEDGNGAGRLVTGTATTAMTTVHTAVTGINAFDEVYLWVANTATANREVTINLGGGNKFVDIIPPQDGLHLMIPGLPFNNGKVVSILATVADQVYFSGYAHRASAT